MNFRLLFLSIVAIACASCSSLKPLEYRSINNFNVSKVTSTPQLTFDLQLFNPNTIGAKLKDFNVSLEMNGIKLTEVKLAEVAHAGAQSEFSIPMNVSTSVDQLVRFLPDAFTMFTSGSSINLHLNGSVTVKKFIFHKTFPFDVQEAFDTKKIRLGK